MPTASVFVTVSGFVGAKGSVGTTLLFAMIAAIAPVLEHIAPTPAVISTCAKTGVDHISSCSDRSTCANCDVHHFCFVCVRPPRHEGTRRGPQSVHDHQPRERDRRMRWRCSMTIPSRRCRSLCRSAPRRPSSAAKRVCLRAPLTSSPSSCLRGVSSSSATTSFGMTLMRRGLQCGS